MLMYGMPLMFGAFSFVFPSGLTLYIFTNTVLTGVHHLYIHYSEKKLSESGLIAKPPSNKGEAKKASSAAKAPAIDVESTDSPAEDDSETPDSAVAKTTGSANKKNKKRGGKKSKKGKKRRS
jgi:membrane protein insertase Oxa1/YidC/SpoIIIJ